MEICKYTTCIHTSPVNGGLKPSHEKKSWTKHSMKGFLAGANDKSLEVSETAGV